MKRIFAGLAAAAVLGTLSLVAPAYAVPPTVTPSPGYDARLQESRVAGTAYRTVVPVSKPVTPRRARRTPAH